MPAPFCCFGRDTVDMPMTLANVGEIRRQNDDPVLVLCGAHDGMIFLRGNARFCDFIKQILMRILSR